MRNEIKFKKTLIGFFDIYAYRSFLKKDLDIRVPILQKNIKFLQGLCKMEWAKQQIKINTFLLSDSFVVYPGYSNPNEEMADTEFIAFFIICSRLLSEAMGSNFPLRGAIGYGDFYYDGNILTSTALSEAYEFEGKQNWLGAVLTPKAQQHLEEMTIEYFPKDKIHPNLINILNKGKIPWKEDEKMEKLLEKDKRYRNEDFIYLLPNEFNDKNWKDKIPDYIDRSSKTLLLLKNSNCLYNRMSD